MSEGLVRPCKSRPCELILGIAALHGPWHALVAASGGLWPQQPSAAMRQRPADREISDLTN